MNIILFGPPGCGKGTQSEKLLKDYKFNKISTGELIRDHIRRNTPFGEEALKYVNSGKLLPDEPINSMVSDFIEKNRLENNFLFDGFPRNVYQAQYLDECLKKYNLIIDYVISLEVDDELLKERIIHRRICPACEKTYHRRVNPPVVEGVCNTCSGPLIQRKDDTLETLSLRLDAFHKEIDPIMAFYHKEKSICRVDATRPIEDVYNQIQACIK